MGLSKSKSKTKTDMTENVTQKPITPPELSAPIIGMGPRIEDFMNKDPTQFVAPTSPLQQKAFDSQLGGWQAPVNNAINMAQAAGSTATPGATATAAAAQGYRAPTLWPAAQAAEIKIDPNARAESQSLLTGLSQYQDPYMRDVVNTTAADLRDEFGRDAAAFSAAGARNKAFGGSRFGIGESQFQADSGRAYANTLGNLRSQAFNTAAQLSGQDADRRQGVSYFNAGADNSRNSEQAQLYQQRELANQAAMNQFRLTQGGMDAQSAAQNAQLAQEANMFNAGNQTDVSQFNAQQAAADQARALQAAGLVGNLGLATGDAQRADTGLTADLGAIQRDIEAARLNAEPLQLQMGAGLLSGLPYQAVVGQNTIGQTKGTTTTTQSPGLLPMAAGLAGAGLSGWASSGFKPIRF